MVFALAGCSSLQVGFLNNSGESTALKDTSSSGPGDQRLAGSPRASLNEEKLSPSTGVAAESDHNHTLYRRVSEEANKDYEEGLVALMENNPPQAEIKFKEALRKVKAAEEQYPREKERWEKLYSALKKEIEEARKDKLPSSPGPEAKAEESMAKADPVLLVSPEDLEKLSRGEKPLDQPRGVNSDLPVVLNETVERYIRVYQTVRRGEFYEGMARMGRYQSYIQKVLKEKGLPQDLIYVGLIESAFNPHVLSRARALGIWQFIPGTGRIYRLRQDFWIDERKDFEKSTEAAANYLQELHRRFGDWSLALAGYNAGAGRVEWAIRRKKSRDYWQLRLPRETKLYVPAIYAATIIAKNAEAYGFKDLKPEAPFEYEKASVPDATDLKIIADCAEVDPELIRQMNPELLRWCTPPQVNYEVRVPVGTKAKFQEKFAQIPKDKWVSWRTHKVRTGENMGKIGRLYRIPAATLAQMNHLKSVHKIRVGQVLMIPVPWGAPIPHQQPVSTAAPAPLASPKGGKIELPAASIPAKKEAKAEEPRPPKTD